MADSLEPSYEYHAKVHQDDTMWKNAIISTIKEHNNDINSPLYRLLWDRKNILTISIDDWRKLVPSLWGRDWDLQKFKKALALLYLEAYWMSVFDLKNPWFVTKFDVQQDHATILLQYFPSDDFIGYVKEQLNAEKNIQLPEWIEVQNVPDDVVEEYLRVARERAEKMGAKEDPTLNLSWIIIEPWVTV